MSMYGTCALCGEEIFEHEQRDIHDQIVSWHTRRRRKGGGAHDKGKLWRSTGAVAHGRCVDAAAAKQRAGTSIHQGGLF
jgi:hypothetical protein